MFRKNKKYDKNKSKDNTKFPKMPNEEYFEQFELSELLKMNANVKQAIDNKMLRYKITYSQDDEYVIINVRDYIVAGRRDELTLIINQDNTIEGYSNYYSRLLIGKISKTGKVYLISFNMNLPCVDYLDGEINLNTGYLNGIWFGNEGATSYMEKMSSLQDSNSELPNLKQYDLSNSLNYDTIKKNIKLMELKIVKGLWYNDCDKQLISQIKDIKCK